MDKLMSIAKIIYDNVYAPEDNMPSFEEAKAEELGGYERCLKAAQEILNG